MAADPKKPVTFELPDGVLALTTWEYIIEKLEEGCRPIVNSMMSINSSITRINAKLDKWLEDQEGEE